jgi:hypothetical protein
MRPDQVSLAYPVENLLANRLEYAPILWSYSVYVSSIYIFVT